MLRNQQAQLLLYGFAFIDSVRHTLPWAVPTGFFLGMARCFGDREWKVETWFLRMPLPSPNWIEERMTTDAKRTILQLKRLPEAGQHCRILALTSFLPYRSSRDASATFRAPNVSPIVFLPSK